MIYLIQDKSTCKGVRFGRYVYGGIEVTLWERTEIYFSTMTHITDYKIALEFFCTLKWDSDIAHRIPTSLGHFIVS